MKCTAKALIVVNRMELNIKPFGQLKPLQDGNLAKVAYFDKACQTISRRTLRKLCSWP